LRSEEAVLELVRVKADALRRRRRTRGALASGALVLALGLAVGVAAIAQAGGAPERAGVIADGTEVGRESTTTTEPVTTTTAVEDGSSPAATLVPQEAVDPAQAPTTTTLAPPELCPASAIRMVLTTDRSRYAAGAEVVVRVEATNISDRDCVESDASSTSIRDEHGVEVFSVTAMASRPPGDWRWRPGETRSGESRWNQTLNSAHGGAQASPGVYSATTTWRPSAQDASVVYSGSSTFVIE
jgi:hypothetical protein